MPHGQHNPHKPHPEPSLALALEAAFCRLDRVADALERMAEAVEAMALQAACSDQADSAEQAGRLRAHAAKLNRIAPAPNTPPTNP